MIGLLSRLGSDPAVPSSISPGEVTLSASGVSFRVEGRWLVRDVNLSLTAGRMTVLIGPNGAGKSTLLSLLAGDLVPSAGEVRVGGRPARDLDVITLARRRAVLPQRTVMTFPFTVGDVVMMGRAPWVGTEREDEDDAAVAAAARSAGVDHLWDRKFPTLSGGEQGMASFARVLAQRTGVLLLDEPTAALDLRHQEQTMRLAAECARAGQAVLVVLHDVGLAAAYADDVAVLADGQLVACGPPRKVLTEELLERVYQLPLEVFEHPGRPGLVIVPRRGGGTH